MRSVGTLALVGSGEFLPPIEPLDRALLERVQGTPRVVVLPTASAPDGPGVPERWASMGVAHFTRLGASVESVALLTREEAQSSALASRVAEANFVYFSGGKPRYLVETLRETACWQAIRDVFQSGGVVAGCSAGAMALVGRLVNFPDLWHTSAALGLGPNVVVIPHFDELPKWLAGAPRRLGGRTTVVGVEGSTGLVGAGLDWEVIGLKAVTVFAHGTSSRYAAGEHVHLDEG